MDVLTAGLDHAIELERLEHTNMAGRVHDVDLAIVELRPRAHADRGARVLVVHHANDETAKLVFLAVDGERTRRGLATKCELHDLERLGERVPGSSEAIRSSGPQSNQMMGERVPGSSEVIRSSGPQSNQMMVERVPGSSEVIRGHQVTEMMGERVPGGAHPAARLGLGIDDDAKARGHNVDRVPGERRRAVRSEALQPGQVHLARETAHDDGDGRAHGCLAALLLAHHVVHERVAGATGQEADGARWLRLAAHETVDYLGERAVASKCAESVHSGQVRGFSEAHAVAGVLCGQCNHLDAGLLECRVHHVVHELLAALAT